MASGLEPGLLDVQRPPSIEEFKHSIQLVEARMTERLKDPAVSDPSSPLCPKCTAIGERLQSIISNFVNDPNPGNIASRDSATNIFLGILSEILAQEDCALCCLISKQFLRSKRQEIYHQFCYQGLQLAGLDDMSVTEIGMLACSVDDDLDDWIQELHSTSVQMSLGTLAVDGTLSLWWPDTIADEINDEPVQILMVAEDHHALFGTPKPWVLLPKVAGHRGRDITMYYKCFDACLSEHKNCTRPPTSSLPGRLIDIESMAIIEVEAGKNPGYFALSYVWGKTPFLQLKRSNKNILSQRGALARQDLPRTISDAITVTSTLGYRYLWVDALCIVQDDLRDKAREIVIMHSIYAAADLTIVAATGNDANAGFLSPESVFLDRTSHLIAGHRFALERREMREVVEFSTWFTRGWTFQELVFSNRILYFTPEQTYFCCKVGNWSEDCPFDKSIPPKVYHDYLRDDDPKLGFDFSNELDPFENYSLMVEKISLRDFTNEGDILDACQGFYSGIVSNEMGDSMCGLPALCFEVALAWQPNGNLRRRGSSSISLNQFPSWSWAGWVGPVTYPFLSGPRKLEISRSISWTLCAHWSNQVRNPSHDTSGDELLKHVLPMPPMINHLTQWSNPPSGFGERRRWQTGSRNFSLLNDQSNEPMWLPIIDSGLLVFKTKSIVCSIHERDAPDLARRRNLRFFSIDHNRSMIGEVKIDSQSLDSLGAYYSPESVDSIELISLFEMDFGKEAMKSLLWMDSLSRRGIFGKVFLDMIEGREDKNMHVVLWIRWDGDVAYRVAAGYVTAEGFEAAGAVEKEIVLG